MPTSTQGSTKAGPRRRPRFAKGARPYFMKDPDVERLLAIVTAQAAELSVLRDRLDTHERLAQSGKPSTPDNVEAFDPDPEVETQRDARRAAMLSRVFRALSAEADEKPAEKAYSGLIDELSR